MSYKQLPSKHFIALFLVAFGILLYMKIWFDITPPPNAYIFIALPFLGFATYYFWDIIMKHKVYGGVAVIVFVAYSISSFPEKKKEEVKKCIGSKKCESAVIQRLESTGSMHLSIKYKGNGVFTGYATKYGSGPTFEWLMKTDCECEIIEANVGL